MVDSFARGGGYICSTVNQLSRKRFEDRKFWSQIINKFASLCTLCLPTTTTQYSISRTSATTIVLCVLKNPYLK
jgi:hypothetical protein